MKKRIILGIWAVLVVLSTLLTISGCESQNLNCFEMILEPRSYTEEEVEHAFGIIKEGFPQKFKNSDLISLVYSEEMQHLTVMDQDLTLEDMVVSVTICGTNYHSARDRSEYFCILNRVPEGDWFIHDWVLGVHTRPAKQEE